MILWNPSLEPVFNIKQMWAKLKGGVGWVSLVSRLVT